jgi:hypothetical protein
MTTSNKGDKQPKKNLPGYPPYPSNEDIYSREEEEDSDPDNPFRSKANEEISDNEGGFPMDVPGADLDDDDEVIGEEDEENNYYSLGQDNEEEDPQD